MIIARSAPPISSRSNIRPRQDVLMSLARSTFDLTPVFDTWSRRRCSYAAPKSGHVPLRGRVVFGTRSSHVCEERMLRVREKAHHSPGPRQDGRTGSSQANQPCRSSMCWTIPRLRADRIGGTARQNRQANVRLACRCCARAWRSGCLNLPATGRAVHGKTDRTGAEPSLPRRSSRWRTRGSWANCGSAPRRSGS